MNFQLTKLQSKFSTNIKIIFLSIFKHHEILKVKSILKYNPDFNPFEIYQNINIINYNFKTQDIDNQKISEEK